MSLVARSPRPKLMNNLNGEIMTDCKKCGWGPRDCTCKKPKNKKILKEFYNLLKIGENSFLWNEDRKNKEQNNVLNIRLQDVFKRLEKLEALEQSGVANWSCYDDAMELLKEWNKK